MKEILEKFTFKQKLLIRWSDLDEIGHVNNALYLTYFEEGRIQYLEQVADWDWKTMGIIVARAEIDYKLPLYLRTKAYLFVRCARIGNKSFNLEYVLAEELESGDRLIAMGTTIMVTYDYTKGQPVPVPEAVREKFVKYEKSMSIN
jgi:acyl-CoA thioester hydrolase